MIRHRCTHTAPDRPEDLQDAVKQEARRQRRPEQLPHRADSEVRHSGKAWAYPSFFASPCFEIHVALCLPSPLRSDVGNWDRSVIQDILKEIAQTQQIDLNAKKRFKGQQGLVPSPLCQRIWIR